MVGKRSGRRKILAITKCQAPNLIRDKGSDSDEIGRLTKDEGGFACISPGCYRTSDRLCDLEFYRGRNLVGNIFQGIKDGRSVSTRSEKLASKFSPFVTDTC
jgi:hypothetical protein